MAGKRILRVLSGEVISPPPVWLMRQAGRYLPEYRELRTKAASFLEFCYTPELAVEATLQPIRRFGFDAAIIFSDILVVPDALGQEVSFESGVGPRLSPITDATVLRRLRDTLNLDRLAPVFEAIADVKKALPEETTLIGFCGAPFTVASYMIAGRATPDQMPARLFAVHHPDLFQELIDRLVACSAEYLARQIDAGAEVVQIFDTWANVLAPSEFEQWCVRPVRAIIAALRKRHADAKVIVFARGAGKALREFAESTRADVLGLDTKVDPFIAAKFASPRIPLQGNLDPLLLVEGGEGQQRATEKILSAFRDRPHIFNLGHGILPETPIGHVETLLAQIRSGC